VPTPTCKTVSMICFAWKFNDFGPDSYIVCITVPRIVLKIPILRMMGIDIGSKIK